MMSVHAQLRRFALLLLQAALLCAVIPSVGSGTASAARSSAAAGGPTLTFAPNPATAGQQVTAFLCNASIANAIVYVTITAANGVVASPSAPIALSPYTGGCSTFPLSAPTYDVNLYSPYTVTVSDGLTTIASGTLTVNTFSVQSVMLLPSPATAGQQVTAILCGVAAAGATVDVSITAANGITVAGLTPVTLAPYADGCASFSLTAPPYGSSYSPYTVTVSNGTTTLASGTLIVSATASGQSLTFSPNPAVAGQTVTGFLCNLPPIINGTTAYVSVLASNGATVYAFAPTTLTPYSNSCYTFPITAPVSTFSPYAVIVGYGLIVFAYGLLTVGPCPPGVAGCATGTLTLSSSSVGAGAAVTVIGCGYSPGDTLALSLAPFGSTAVVYSEPVPSLNASGSASNGALCFTTTFTVPANLPAGPYTVTLTGSPSGILDTATLTVGTCTGATTGCPSGAPSLSSSPATPAPGQTVTLAGSGFAPGAAVTISGLGMEQTATAASDGTFTLSFAVPASAVIGAYTLTAKDSTGRAATTSVTVTTSTATASITASASSGTPGQSITVTGAGFQDGEQVSLSLGTPVTSGTASALAGTIQLFTVGGNGTFTAQYTVPSIAAGSYDLLALGQSSRLLAGVPFTVTGTPRLTGTISPSTTTAQTGQQITVAGAGFQPEEQISVSLGTPVSSGSPTALPGTTQTFTADNNGNVNAQYRVPSVVNSSYDLLVRGQSSGIVLFVPFTVAGTMPAPAPSPTVTPPPPAPAPPVSTPALPAYSAPTITYFADAYTGTAAANGKATFAVHLSLYNPGPGTSRVTTTYYVYDPAARTHTGVSEQDSVPPGATAIRSVNQDAGDDRLVSVVVSAGAGIVAEERIDRVSSAGATLDSDSSLGSPRLDAAWYFAEGYTGSTFQEYLTLFNPGATVAHAQVHYLPGGSTSAPPPQPVTVPAQSQVTINVRSQYNHLAPAGPRSIAIAVTSDVAIAVDRALYWGAGSGSGKYGYSLAPGISAGAHSQYFSLLPTSGGSQSFITVLNPNSSATTVSLRLVTASGATLKTVSQSVGAHARYTFVVPSLAVGDNGNLSGGLLSSALPVIAEAAIYFGGSPNAGSHPGMVIQGSVGAPAGARADVDARGALLQVYNPHSRAVRVQVTLGTAVVFDGMVPGNATQLVTLPSRGSAGGVLVLASAPCVATLLNGGPGGAKVWGGSVS